MRWWAGAALRSTWVAVVGSPGGGRVWEERDGGTGGEDSSSVGAMTAEACTKARFVRLPVLPPSPPTSPSFSPGSTAVELYASYGRDREKDRDERTSLERERRGRGVGPIVIRPTSSSLVHPAPLCAFSYYRPRGVLSANSARSYPHSRKLATRGMRFNTFRSFNMREDVGAG